MVVASALGGPEAEGKPFIPTERGWAIDRHPPSSNSKLYRWVFGDDVETEIRFQLPGYRWEIISNDKARLLTLTCLTPEAPKRTRITQFTWWTGAPLLHLAVPIAKPMARKFLRQMATWWICKPGHGPPESHDVDRRHRHPGQMVPAAKT